MLYQRMWQQHDLQKDCRAYVKLLLYCITGWWRIWEDIVEKEAEEGQQQEEEVDVDLTLKEHERALKGAYRRFVIPGAPKTDINSYFDQTNPHIKT